jgi:hypothetical protein
LLVLLSSCFNCRLSYWVPIKLKLLGFLLWTSNSCFQMAIRREGIGLYVRLRGSSRSGMGR